MFDALFAKEGPVEHVSHVIVGVAACLWLLLGRRHPTALVGALFLLIILGEETDWGHVYGLRGAGANLHNAYEGHFYTVFALPLLLFYGAAALVPERLRLAVGEATPERFDVGVFSLCVLLGPIVGLTVLSVHELALDELFELALYLQCAGFAIVGLVAQRRDRATSSARA